MAPAVPGDRVKVPWGQQGPYEGYVIKVTTDGKYLIRFDCSDTPHKDADGSDYRFSSDQFSVIAEEKSRRSWNDPTPVQKAPLISDLFARFRSSYDLPSDFSRHGRSAPVAARDRQFHRPSDGYGPVRHDRRPGRQLCQACRGRGYTGSGINSTLRACEACSSTGSVRPSTDTRTPRMLPLSATQVALPINTTGQTQGSRGNAKWDRHITPPTSRPSGDPKDTVIKWKDDPTYDKPHAGQWQWENQNAASRSQDRGYWVTKAASPSQQSARIPKPPIRLPKPPTQVPKPPTWYKGFRTNAVKTPEGL